MDLQHLNKTEARLQDLKAHLQDLEHRIMQPATEGIAISSVSIEQETLAGVLNSVLPQTRPDGYSSVATQAAEAIKAAFKVLSPDVSLASGGYVGPMPATGVLGGSVSAVTKAKNKESHAISIAIEVDKTSLDDAESQLQRIAELAKRSEKQPFNIKDGQVFINAAVINDALISRNGITAIQIKEETEQSTLNQKESALGDKLSKLEDRLLRLIIALEHSNPDIRGI